MKILAIKRTEENLKKYWNKNQKEWNELINDPNNQYDSITFFKEHGEDHEGYFEVKTIGQPTTIQEKLIERIYGDDPTFEHMSDLFPEDFIESKTSWYELYYYANNMKYFIESLNNMI